MSGKVPVLGETERLLLRIPEEGDLDLIADLWADSAATAYIGGPRDRGMVADFFREYAADPEPYARDEGERWWSIVERRSGEFAGLCSLLEKEVAGQTETELGYYLLPAYWGQGYATEAAGLVAAHAFSDLQLASLVAIIDPDNAGSIAVARKLGMRFEWAEQRSDGVVRHVYRKHSSLKGDRVQPEVAVRASDPGSAARGRELTTPGERARNDDRKW
jgi:RimJ/RimL family protein N-acetyltransferase